MSEYIKISPEIRALGREAEREIRPFQRLEEICDRNTEKVLAAFARTENPTICLPVRPVTATMTTAVTRSTRSTPIFSAPRPHSCVSAL
ncbi:MAG: hypothetical protein ACLT2F_09940 [Butyricicoccus sp.]